MWIGKRRFNALEKKVADLEKSQLQAVDMVKQYIEDTESLSKELCKEIQKLPLRMKEELDNHCGNK